MTQQSPPTGATALRKKNMATVEGQRGKVIRGSWVVPVGED